MTTRRPPFADLKVSVANNTSLWLDKFIEDQPLAAARGSDSKKTDLVKEVASIDEPDLYHNYYERWVASLAELNTRMQAATTGKVECKKATVEGRMVVGIGNEGVLETSITLHRTYGV